MATDDEPLFAGKLGTGMEVGAVVNGNLRLKVDLEDGGLAVLELPHRWLVGRGGLAAFIKDNCHPGGPPPFRCEECRGGDCNECCVIDGFRGSCQCSCAGGPIDDEED